MLCTMFFTVLKMTICIFFIGFLGIFSFLLVTKNKRERMEIAMKEAIVKNTGEILQRRPLLEIDEQKRYIKIANHNINNKISAKKYCATSSKNHSHVYNNNENNKMLLLKHPNCEEVKNISDKRFKNFIYDKIKCFHKSNNNENNKRPFVRHQDCEEVDNISENTFENSLNDEIKHFSDSNTNMPLVSHSDCRKMENISKETFMNSMNGEIKDSPVFYDNENKLKQLGQHHNREVVENINEKMLRMIVGNNFSHFINPNNNANNLKLLRKHLNEDVLQNTPERRFEIFKDVAFRLFHNYSNKVSHKKKMNIQSGGEEIGNMSEVHMNNLIGCLPVNNNNESNGKLLGNLSDGGVLGYILEMTFNIFANDVFRYYLKKILRANRFFVSLVCTKDEMMMFDMFTGVIEEKNKEKNILAKGYIKTRKCIEKLISIKKRL